ncbi:MAG: YdiU family protein, partial [Rhodobacteraceae bacterium]|nr:YdiU family protein [Paracoccaceae bacterium]
GPCAFMDRFDARKVFSSIDRMGRYAYNRQPDIAVWNLAQFATCLLPQISANRDEAIDLATQAVHRFPERFADAWLAVFRAKLGLRADPDDEDLAEADSHLINDFLQALQTGQGDFTNSFAALPWDQAALALTDPAPLVPWRQAYDRRIADQGGPDLEAMHRANPRVIPRNHRIEDMIAAAVAGDFAPFRRLLETVTRPFDRAPEHLTRPPNPDEEVLQTFCGT